MPGLILGSFTLLLRPGLAVISHQGLDHLGHGFLFTIGK